MSSVQRLPAGGTWTYPENSLPSLGGTDAREELKAKRGEDSVLIGRGGADQLWGAPGKNFFTYERLTDSLSDDPDTIFNFNPKEDDIDVSEVLKQHKIVAINIQDSTPQKVGDVQLIHDGVGVSTLTIKVTPEGPNFSIRVDSVKLLPKHINFFN